MGEHREPSPLRFRTLGREDIPLVEDVPPPEWHFPFGRFLELHLGSSYFHPIVGTAGGQIVGVGNAIVNETVAWLGNIIVPPAERGRGIGSRLTERLIEICKERGCGTLVLIATTMGEPVYRKLGFVATGLYRFYRGGSDASATDLRRIRRMRAEDHAAVLALDRVVSGEGRGPLLSRFLATGWVHEREDDGRVDGHYLPALGAGLVIAANDEAGISLLRLKLRHAPSLVVVPDGNEVAKKWLVSNGHSETLAAPRMCLGPEVAWQAHLVFSRGAGYCG
jgi:GNAT superfamily N-acetyltransferase